MTAAMIEQTLAQRRTTISPRFTPPRTPLRSRFIHGGALALWVLLFARAFGGGGVFAWSAGLAYIGYDTILLCFVFWQTLALLRPLRQGGAKEMPPATIIVAAHNEAAVLPITLTALLAQTSPADTILIADDGSTDQTAALLETEYGLTTPPIDALSPRSTRYPQLRWLRLPHGGKARALNMACASTETELVLTVDADTLLDPAALGAMQQAFAAESQLGRRHRRADTCMRRVPLGAPSAMVSNL